MTLMLVMLVIVMVFHVKDVVVDQHYDIVVDQHVVVDQHYGVIVIQHHDEVVDLH